MKTFPNDPCPCGSGKKYKKCCDRIVITEVPKISKEESKKQLAALLGIAAMLEKGGKK